MNAEDRSRAIRRGMAKAARNGRRPGRKAGEHRKPLDLDLVRRLQAEGQPLRIIAKTLGVSHSLLVKRLNEDPFLDDLLG
jgi:DNA invertase Pin-like site-specific DNA recombinase